MFRLLPVLLVAAACSGQDGDSASPTDADADGYTREGGDCNDSDPGIHPDAVDSCDGLDNDCDGEIDEVLPDTLWCPDVDGDGFGDITHQTRTCFPETGWVQDCTDCDDAVSAVNPDAVESCNGVDDDCDGATDPANAVGSTAWYPDADGDGYGGTDGAITACELPGGFVADNSDCDDSTDDTHPSAPEICNDGRDNNCDDDTNGCGWAGTQLLSTRFAGFIQGPDVSTEYVGFGVGFLDLDLDGVDDLWVHSFGEMYGDDSMGALHFWYGVPAGEEKIEAAEAHLIGGPELWLGAWARSPSVVRLTDPESGDGRLLLASGGLSAEFDVRGVVLAMDAIPSGETQVSPSMIFATGAVAEEGFGTTVRHSGSVLGEQTAVLFGAPFNTERGGYSGALYVGTPDAPDAADARATILGQEDEVVGCAVVVADVTGDGVDDVVLGNADYAAPRLHLLQGPLSGRMTTEEADRTASVPGWQPEDVSGIPDLDGDGLPDLAVEGQDDVELVSGLVAAEGSDAPAILGSLGKENEEGRGAYLSFATGDVGADGIPDLLVGVGQLDTPPEYGAVFEGGAVVVVPLDRSYAGKESLYEVASAVYYGPDRGGWAGYSLALGDPNADGYLDVLFGAPGWSSNGYRQAGGVWFLLGGGV